MSQRVLITAGADGIGSEAATFAAGGTNVCICDIHATALALLE